MLSSLISSLFRCAHSRTTFPITLPRRDNLAARNTYIVCLTCGKELAYDWDKMQVGKTDSARSSGIFNR